MTQAELGNTCTHCRREGFSEQRKEWGCDEPTDYAQFYTPCTECHGTDPKCLTCDGDGSVPSYRCPHALLTRTSAHFLALHATWPKLPLVAGGYEDQPARYIAAMRELDAAKAQMEQEQMEEQRREMDRATRKQGARV